MEFHFAGTDEHIITILEGSALPQREPRIPSVSGIINAPYMYLFQRVQKLNQKECLICVDRDKMTIKLSVNETDPYGPTITGSLELHPLFVLFGINADKWMSNIEMAKLFKMNRSAFEVQAQAMNLVAELQNFRAKVNREVEKLGDNRGNKTDLLVQVVESNLPDRFNLCIPIFKGTKKQTIEVEVYIKPEDLSCCLISPQAADLIAALRDEEVDNVLKAIYAVAPDIVVIEQ